MILSIYPLIHGYDGRLFETIDVNSNGYLSVTDIRALIIGIQFDAADLDIDETVKSVMKDFDATGDSQIDMNEFVSGMSRWLTKAKRSAIHACSDGSDSLSTRYINDFNLVCHGQGSSFSSSSPECL